MFYFKASLCLYNIGKLNFFTMYKLESHLNYLYLVFLDEFRISLKYRKKILGSILFPLVDSTFNYVYGNE